MGFSDCPDDESFGPVVRGCRGDFDFTIKFERIFFSIVPAAVVLIASCIRGVILFRRQPQVGGGGWLITCKWIFNCLHVSLHLPLVVLGAEHSVGMAALFVVSDALGLLAAASIALISFLEHRQSPRPSHMLGVSLLLLIILECAKCRTLGLAADSRSELVYTGISIASLVAKAVILALESRKKSNWLLWEGHGRSPEETCGIFNLSSFYWLNRQLLAGFKRQLSIDSLYPLDSRLAEKSEASISRKITMLSGQRHGLARWLARAFLRELLLPVGPRIALIGFKWSQPFLLVSVVQFLGQGSRPKAHGYGLVGATILVYGGIAATTALYWYLHERLLCLIRGRLMSAVYASMLGKSIASEHLASSSGLTMITADVERIRVGLLQLHEFWGTAVEVTLACVLLGVQLGPAVVAPVVLVGACVLVSAGLSRLTARRQRRWMGAVQSRVGLTTTLISNIRGLKMSGLAPAIEEMIQRMREEEIADCGRYRQMQLVGIVLAFLPSTMSPVISLAFTRRPLSADVLFNTVSYFLLLTAPLSQMFPAVPNLFGALASLGRIQAFLEERPTKDLRQIAQKSAVAVRIENGNFGWDADSFVLWNINLHIPSSRLTVILGPAASGKSTLCRAILGEVPHVQGRIALGTGSKLIGLCDQPPFLRRATIRENIVGSAFFDRARYAEVVDHTQLAEDFANFAQGDETLVGSNAINLSGGQKQRISLARALYQYCDLIILDDSLAGLDSKTEEQITRRVFGPDGLLARRGTTSILCTHSVRPMEYAGCVVALGGDGKIAAAGRPDDLSLFDLWQGQQAGKPDQSRPNTRSSSPLSLERQEGAHSSSNPPPKRNWEAYRLYIKNVGSFSLALFVLVGLAAGFFGSFHTVWLTFWSKDLHPPSSHGKPYWLGTYAALRMAYLASIFLLSLLAVRQMIMVPGAALHRSVLTTAVAAPLRYFTQVDTGTITSLLSQDMTIVDAELPIGILLFTSDFFLALGVACVIPTSSAYLLVSYPILFSVLWFIQNLYLRTARQLRILELEAKGPLHSHFLSTSQGLTTVRAFGWMDESIQTNDHLLNTAQRPAYLLAMAQRWLAFAMQMVVATLAVLLVTVSTQLKGSAGLMGASLMTLMTFGETLAIMVRNVSLVDICIGAVYRIQGFTEETPQEPTGSSAVQPPHLWPAVGSVMIEAVSASYGGFTADGEPMNLALNDINLRIKPGERVVICGRTGSGKSSILLLLLRLLDPSRGSVSIDGVSLRDVDPKTIRNRIITIPQEIQFSIEGLSVKAHLGLDVSTTDAECGEVCRMLGLLAFVQSHGGLDAKLKHDTFSQGQWLLLGVARAVIRHRARVRKAGMAEKEGVAVGGVLLLDEVNSRVDTDTERLIMDVLETEFAGYTVIMVSHRLDGLLHFDKAIVMDAGRVVETGRPTELIRQEGSRFRELRNLGGAPATSRNG